MSKDFPKLDDGDRRISLRFSLPKISFGAETIRAYEESVGIPYLSILENVLAAEGLSVEPGRSVPIKYTSTAQGMLFYLAKLWETRSHAQATQAPINSSMVVHWRRRYPFFDETVFDFESEMADSAEEELYSRAVLGADSPVVVNGAIQYVTKKSDDLLKFYLTHNRPKRYGVKSEVTAKVDANVKADVTLGRGAFAHLSDNELAAIEEMLNRGKNV